MMTISTDEREPDPQIETDPPIEYVGYHWNSAELRGAEGVIHRKKKARMEHFIIHERSCSCECTWKCEI